MNRFVPCASRRTKNLPDGGNLPDEVLDEFGPLIAQSIEHGRTKVLPLVERTPEAGDLWAASYADLRSDRPDGAVAKMLARAAPNTLRVALAYALADRRRQIDVEHMRAALALWRYAEQSAEWLFGGQIDTGELESLVAFITAAGTDRPDQNRDQRRLLPAATDHRRDRRHARDADRGRPGPTAQGHVETGTPGHPVLPPITATPTT